jgi:hypothetical protein
MRRIKELVCLLLENTHHFYFESIFLCIKYIFKKCFFLSSRTFTHLLIYELHTHASMFCHTHASTCSGHVANN